MAWWQSSILVQIRNTSANDFAGKADHARTTRIPFSAFFFGRTFQSSSSMTRSEISSPRRTSFHCHQAKIHRHLRRYEGMKARRVTLLSLSAALFLGYGYKTSLCRSSRFFSSDNCQGGEKQGLGPSARCDYLQGNAEGNGTAKISVSHCAISGDRKEAPKGEICFFFFFSDRTVSLWCIWRSRGTSRMPALLFLIELFATFNLFLSLWFVFFFSFERHGDWCWKPKWICCVRIWLSLVFIFLVEEIMSWCICSYCLFRHWSRRPKGLNCCRNCLLI